MHFYSDEEIKYLEKISPGKTNKEITRLFNERFKLDLSEAVISATRKRYGIKSGLNGRFKKGHAPWNKGLKGVVKGGIQTQFKKGNEPPNRVPKGTERISKDGYTYVKIQDGHLNNNWKLKHVLIWEKHNGPVPKGYVVIFGDGNKQNFDINNLILVSRQQLLILNKKRLIQKDADLTRTAVIVADIYKQINKRRS